MEDRANARKATMIRVILDYPSLGLVSGTARNISVDGMYVETGGAILPRNTPVKALFSLEMDGRITAFQQATSVTWLGQEGLGLTFQGPDHALSGALRAFVYGRASPRTDYRAQSPSR